MIRYPVVILLTGLLTGYMITPSSGARLTEALQQRLRTNNFNVLSVPARASDMPLKTLEGANIRLSALRGKVIILNFWKIDCPPCSLEKPILERIHRKYANKGLEIVAVNLFDDEKQIRSYLNKAGFSFTCAHDPDNRLDIRKQYLSSGIPTSFVVNSDSEAIYELPGVPTTYVIDRQGQIAGTSVGMIDWEQRPFVELVEALLGTHSIAKSESVPVFAEAARQGPTSSGVGVRTGPRRVENGVQEQSGPSPDSMPPPGTAAREPAKSPPTLPFGSPATPPGSVQAPPSVVAPTVPSTGTGVGPSETSPETSKKPTRARKKPEPGQTAKPAPHQAKPKQYMPDTWGGGALPPQAPPVTGRPLPGAVPPLPPLPPAGSPSATTGQPYGTSLPILPPAIPYTPPRSVGQPATRPVLPDESGRVTATIPPTLPQGAQGGIPFSPPQVTPVLPPGQQMGQTNTIDDFILDSFGRPRPQVPAATQPPPPPARGAAPTSLLDQMGRDVRELGQGIKDVFSRIVPLQ